MRKWRIQPKRNIMRKWYNRIIAGNGEIVFVSESYWSTAGCINAAHRAAEETGLGIDWQNVERTLK